MSAFSLDNRAITTLLTCLVNQTGCTLDATTAGLISTDYTALVASSCTLTDACTCQKTYFETDQNAGDAAVCSAITTYYNCLTGKTNLACDGTSTVKVLADAAFTNIPTTCTEKTSTCTCQIAYTKGDISDNTKKCTVAKEFISCLAGENAVGCDTSVTVSTLATDANTIITGIVSGGGTCDRTDVCDCEIAYAIADISDNAKRCTETKALTSCIQTSINDGCGASRTKMNVGTAAQAVFTTLTNAVCAVTTACQCQIDFNKASVTAADKCTSGTTLGTCLEAVTPTTTVGCNGTITAADLTPDMKTRVKDILCSSAEMTSKSSIVISLLMLMTSVLFMSP